MATASKNKGRKKTAPHAESPKEKEPSYMVQVGDPKMLRKDLLESLREIIIFMQGYEKFRKIQEEKLSTFGTLRTQVKEINNLVDNKLRHYFPKGKLKPFLGVKQKEAPADVAEQPAMVEVEPPLKTLPAGPKPVARSDLDELESQLKDIENQLRDIS
ncbi:TPA: hypothetical protein HA242_00200 [Candidatus Woesearchaeota archaeon]|nr:hypothetical protein [Candidatus Woesearchaeota archaeon]HIH12125.1 hypothetical protein [Candidatus Woesearchaeota archaeon]